MQDFHRIINCSITLPVGILCLVNTLIYLLFIVFIDFFALVSDCSRICINGGSLDEENCTCACADGYSGDNCESKPILL